MDRIKSFEVRWKYNLPDAKTNALISVRIELSDYDCYHKNN